VPSTPLEKYSALLVAVGVVVVGGRAATVSMLSAMMAPIRLTTDSRASERRPTEPVIRYATVLSAIVATAAAIESQAKLTSDGRVVMVGAMASRAVCLAAGRRGDLAANASCREPSGYRSRRSDREPVSRAWRLSCVAVSSSAGSR